MISESVALAEKKRKSRGEDQDQDDRAGELGEEQGEGIIAFFRFERVGAVLQKPRGRLVAGEAGRRGFQLGQDRFFGFCPGLHGRIISFMPQ